jgi:alkylation response protein AidB-like acyl-CoA dehydrogenase
MELVLSEEHEMVQRAARDFVASRSSLRRVKAGGWSRELWAEMARLGWLGLTMPEEHGGSGAGHVYAMVVGEELGRGLMPEPWLATVLLGAGALAATGHTAHLPAIAAGERLVALAYEEPGMRFAWERAATTFSGGVLRGEKVLVMGGASADWLVVTARGDDGLVLAIVAAQAPGVTVVPQRRLDGRDCALVRFDAARAEPLGPAAALAPALDAATIGLCAEMLGGMEAAFDMTIEHLKTRVQFGVPIGTFQALQHRAAHLFCDIELARAAVWSAHALLDSGADARALARAASLAKAKCSEVYMNVAHEAIQMHGGIGMTEEHDIGLYLKRARVAEMTFGDAAYHRDRYARLNGF